MSARTPRSCSQRVSGDKLIAIDYLGGGSAPEFHVLTWVISGPCNVGSHTAPCWGADVLELDPAEAEGGVNNVNLTAAQNPISDVALVAGKFAEFGVNLTDSDIIPPGECEGFAQAIWESRASGSSFVSSTKDITIEEVNINNCGTVEVTKSNDDGPHRLVQCSPSTRARTRPAPSSAPAPWTRLATACRRSRTWSRAPTRSTRRPCPLVSEGRRLALDVHLGRGRDRGPDYDEPEARRRARDPRTAPRPATRRSRSQERCSRLTGPMRTPPPSFTVIDNGTNDDNHHR